MMRRNSIIAFHHVFIITFYAVSLQKLFFTDETGTRKIATLAEGCPLSMTLTLTQERGQSFGGQFYGGHLSVHGRNIKNLIPLKRHTFNIKHYLHKSYLHKSFIFLNSKLLSSKLFRKVY